MRNPRNDRAELKEEGHPQCRVKQPPAASARRGATSDPTLLHEGVEGSRERVLPIDSPSRLRGGAGGGSSSSAPERTCILTRGKGERGALIRLALAPDGQVHPDVRAKAPGRGAWIGVTRPELETALAKGKLKGALARAFKTGEFTLPANLPQRIEEALSRAALERLGLEARASTLVTGSDRIAETARKGNVHALYHAADSRADGRRKLDQAWRVGTGQEGSDAAGLVLAADRTILSVALGRENVVHIGVIDARAAARVSAAIDRWHGFIDFASSSRTCASVAQRSVAGGASV